MKRIVYIAAALIVTALPFAAQPAKAAVSVQVHVGDAYRGASLSFHSEPRVVMVPRSRVYFARDYDRDLYRFRNHWYFVEDGSWYRSTSWGGPFRHVNFHAVPVEIRRLPARYRARWYAPYRDYDRRWDQARSRDRESNRDWDRVRDEWNRNGDQDRDGDRDRNRDRDRNWDRSDDRDGRWDGHRG
jgi:hypothetical protein